MTKNMKNINLNVRISEELKDEFYEVCEKNIQTPSMVLRKLIEEFIDREMDVFKTNE